MRKLTLEEIWRKLLNGEELTEEDLRLWRESLSEMLEMHGSARQSQVETAAEDLASTITQENKIDKLASFLAEIASAEASW